MDLERLLKIFIYIFIFIMWLISFFRSRGTIRTVLFVVDFFVVAGMFLILTFAPFPQQTNLLLCIGYIVLFNLLMFLATQILSKRKPKIIWDSKVTGGTPAKRAGGKSAAPPKSAEKTILTDDFVIDKERLESRTITRKKGAGSFSGDDDRPVEPTPVKKRPSLLDEEIASRGDAAQPAAPQKPARISPSALDGGGPAEAARPLRQAEPLPERRPEPIPERKPARSLSLDGEPAKPAARESDPKPAAAPDRGGYVGGVSVGDFNSTGVKFVYGYDEDKDIVMRKREADRAKLEPEPAPHPAQAAPPPIKTDISEGLEEALSGFEEASQEIDQMLSGMYHDIQKPAAPPKPKVSQDTLDLDILGHLLDSAATSADMDYLSGKKSRNDMEVNSGVTRRKSLNRYFVEDKPKAVPEPKPDPPEKPKRADTLGDTDRFNFLNARTADVSKYDFDVHIAPSVSTSADPATDAPRRETPPLGESRAEASAMSALTSGYDALRQVMARYDVTFMDSGADLTYLLLENGSGEVIWVDFVSDGSVFISKAASEIAFMSAKALTAHGESEKASGLLAQVCLSAVDTDISMKAYEKLLELAGGSETLSDALVAAMINKEEKLLAYAREVAGRTKGL